MVVENLTIACNVWDKIPGPDEIYGVAGSKTRDPTTRSVFRIEKVSDGRRAHDPRVHYGDKIRLVASDRLFGEQKKVVSIQKFYLISNPTSIQSHAKLSGKQEVLLTTKQSNASLWEIEHTDAKIRFDAMGHQVMVGQPVLLKHVQTSQWLAVDHFTFLSSMYGPEHEIFVHSYLKPTKTQNLIAEQEGRTTIDIPLRGQEPQNSWVVVAAKAPHEDFDDHELVEVSNRRTDQ